MYSVWKRKIWLHLGFGLIMIAGVWALSNTHPVFMSGITGGQQHSGHGQEAMTVMSGAVTNSQLDPGSFPEWLHDDLQQVETVQVTATGYYAGYESTGKEPGDPAYGITFSGVKVRRIEEGFSTIAADPNVFPIGTIMYIPGYGYGIVADTGSAIKGHTIDLYFNTKEDVFAEWGKKTVEVYVLKKGDGTVTEVMMDQLNANKAIPVDNPVVP